MTVAKRRVKRQTGYDLFKRQKSREANFITPNMAAKDVNSALAASWALESDASKENWASRATALNNGEILDEADRDPYIQIHLETVQSSIAALQKVGFHSLFLGSDTKRNDDSECLGSDLATSMLMVEEEVMCTELLSKFRNYCIEKAQDPEFVPLATIPDNYEEIDTPQLKQILRNILNYMTFKATDGKIALFKQYGYSTWEYCLKSESDEELQFYPVQEMSRDQVLDMLNAYRVGSLKVDKREMIADPMEMIQELELENQYYIVNPVGDYAYISANPGIIGLNNITVNPVNILPSNQSHLVIPMKSDVMKTDTEVFKRRDRAAWNNELWINDLKLEYQKRGWIEQRDLKQLRKALSNKKQRAPRE